MAPPLLRWKAQSSPLEMPYPQNLEVRARSKQTYAEAVLFRGQLRDRRALHIRSAQDSEADGAGARPKNVAKLSRADMAADCHGRYLVHTVAGHHVAGPSGQIAGGYSALAGSDGRVDEGCGKQL